MYLHRIHLNPRCKEARRDLADPYQLHSTLCRAFSESDKKCSAGEFLWRLEPEVDPEGYPRVLVQSRSMANWDNIGIKGWLAQIEPAINVKQRLKLDSLDVGLRYRFRLRANPSVKRKGKRLGLLRLEEQEKWLVRKGEQHGFSLPRVESFDLTESSDCLDVRISNEQMLRGKQHDGNGIHLYSVLYEGVLIVRVPDAFQKVLIGGVSKQQDGKVQKVNPGIGHGRGMGLGMLSVVPSV